MNFIKDCITFFQAGGVFMYPLAACSVLLIAAIIYRMFNMKRSTICPARLTRAVEQYTRGALERSELERMAADSGSVEGRLVLDALILLWRRSRPEGDDPGEGPARSS